MGSGTKKLLIGCGIALGVLVLLVCGGLVTGAVYLGQNSPETFVQAAEDVRPRFLEVVRELDILEVDEEIVFFYSDALLDLEEGLYLATDRRVLIYSTYYFGDEPLQSFPYEEITRLDLERETSFLVDSDLTVEDLDGNWVTFPLSSERGGDVRFTDYVRSQCPLVE